MSTLILRNRILIVSIFILVQAIFLSGGVSAAKDSTDTALNSIAVNSGEIDQETWNNPTNLALQQPEILWEATHEVGNMSEWEVFWNSGSASQRAVAGPARSGQYSAALTIDTSGGRAAVRMPVRTVNDGSILPDEAYYSVWYYIPPNIKPDVAWNIMDWKTARDDHWSDNAMTMNLWLNDNGQYYLSLFTHVGNDGKWNGPGHGTLATARNVTFEPNTWAQVECYYRWSTSNGAIRCWLNGVEVWNLENVVTQFDVTLYSNASLHPTLPRQWKINHYSSGLSPDRSTIYIDDAMITTQRVSQPNPTTPPVVSQNGCYVNAPPTASEGETFTATVQCDNVTDGVYGFQLGTSANGPISPSTTSYTPGSFTTDAGGNILEGGANSLSQYAVSRRSPAQPASGSFTLASMEYTVAAGITAEMTATISLDELILGDVMGNPLTNFLAAQTNAVIKILPGDTDTLPDVPDPMAVSGTLQSEMDVNTLKTPIVTVGTQTATTQETPGSRYDFSISDSFPSAAQPLFADAAGHLECAQMIDVDSIGAATITLRGGDVVDDGDISTPATIDLLDSVAVGLAIGDNTSTEEDINADGAVDVLDLIPVGRNYLSESGPCF